MDAYRVGQLFPHEQYRTCQELNVAIPTAGFFHILMSLKKISRKERKLFARGTITASLFEQRDIPFLVVNFGENFSIDISFDISKFDDETRRVWLASETNAIAYISCGSNNRDTGRHPSHWRRVCSRVASNLCQAKRSEGY